jgi:hypothetical protein
VVEIPEECLKYTRWGGLPVVKKECWGLPRVREAIEKELVKLGYNPDSLDPWADSDYGYIYRDRETGDMVEVIVNYSRLRDEMIVNIIVSMYVD